MKVRRQSDSRLKEKNRKDFDSTEEFQFCFFKAQLKHFKLKSLGDRFTTQLLTALKKKNSHSGFWETLHSSLTPNCERCKDSLSKQIIDPSCVHTKKSSTVQCVSPTQRPRHPSKALLPRICCWPLVRPPGKNSTSWITVSTAMLFRRGRSPSQKPLWFSGVYVCASQSWLWRFMSVFFADSESVPLQLAIFINRARMGASKPHRVIKAQGEGK